MTEPIDKPSALVRAPDAYESAFMGANEDVVFRDKIKIHPAFHVLMAIATLGGIAGVIASGGPRAAAAVMIFVGLFVWGSTAALRTTVTRENLHIQYGWIGPTIPMQSIESVKPVKYSVLKYGGWGVRYSIFDGSWCYNMIGDRGQAVEVLHRKKGKLKKVLVASKDPEGLSYAIKQSQEVLIARYMCPPIAARHVEFDFGEEHGADVEESVANHLAE